MKIKQIIAILVIVVLIANIALLALRQINILLFWGIIILAAIFTFKVLPRLREV